MSQGLRDMLANRRFAIPLIILLAFCFIGLILIGVVLIWQPGASDDGGVAQVTDTATPTPTETETATPTATATSTTRPSPTLVPVGSTVPGTAETPGGEGTLPPGEVEQTEVAAEQTMTASAGQTPGAPEATTPVAEATDTPGPTDTAVVDDEELAQTGVGWGLILFSGVGLGLLAIAARRLRMAS